MNIISTIRRNSYAKMIILIVLIVGVVFGFFFGLRFVLNTDNAGKGGGKQQHEYTLQHSRRDRPIP